MNHDDPNAGWTCPAGPDGALGVDGKDAPMPPKPPDPKPKRGRPRCSEEPLGPVTVHLPTPTQDRIIRLASQRKQPVSEYLRDVMAQLFGGRS